MSTKVLSPTATSRRRSLLTRTAICGVLTGAKALAPTMAMALPVGGLAEVNAGGGLPSITSTAHRTDVTLNAARTVLTWTSFDVGVDETVSFNFASRDWMVLNRINGLTNSQIEGVVEGRVGSAYGGNIWFASQSNIIFGRGSQIDAGSIFVTLGTPNTSTFLDPSNTLFSFNGGDTLPGSRLWVLANAKVTAHGGMVGFMGPTIVTRANAQVTALDGSVLYGAAKNFQIRLAPGVGGDFDLVDFIVPTGNDGTDNRLAIDLAGDTRASAVFLAAVNKTTLSTAIVNLEGMVTATAAKADGGDIVLSGGGGITNRQPGESLADTGFTEIFLNKGAASRDLNVRNVGPISARPWLRPPEETKDPLSIKEETDPDFCDLRGDCPGNGFGNGNGNGNGFGVAPLPLDAVVLDSALVAALFDPTAISAISAGRDARISATQTIELGRITANRDVDVTGKQVEANSLIAAGNLNVASTEGDVLLAGVGVTRDGAIAAKTDVQIGSVSAPQKLNVTAGRDITLGEGMSTVSGVISLTAPQNVTVNLASAKIDRIDAGANANLRGGAIEVNTLTSPRVNAQAESLKIGTATTSGDLYIVATNGDASVGAATAGDDIFVLSTNGVASLGEATLTGAAPDVVGITFVGNPDVAGNGRVVHVESTNLDARLGLGTGGVTGATSVTVRAGQDAVVEVLRELPGAVSVAAARDATLRAPTVRLDTVSAGRDLTVGSTVGDFELTTSLVATRNVTVSAAGALRVGDVRADAGSVSLSGATVTAGNVLASEDLILRALSGGVTTTSYRTGRDLILQGTSLSLDAAIAPIARDLSITSLGNFTSSTPLSAGRNVTIDVAGLATLGQTNGAGTVRIAAGDLNLTGLITAPLVQIEARGGAMTVGGAAGSGGGFRLDNAEFGQIRASEEVRLYAGLTTGTSRGDLTLLDLAVNPGATPRVSFLVGSANDALVNGVAAPTASGGILRIGDAVDLNWRPDSILVTGALGAATYQNGDYINIRAFDQVRLAAREDILMGSPRFISLIQATPPEAIDLAAGSPAGVAPQGAELLKVYVSAGLLEVSSENKVVQQNAAPSGTAQSVGLFFTGQFRPALIIDPPKVVELWGAFAGPDGRTLTGTAANEALTFVVLDASGAPISKPDGAEYRFNSCDVGTTTCAPLGIGGGDGGSGDPSGMSDALLRTRDALSGDLSDDLSEDGLTDAVSAENLINPPAILGVASPSPDEIITDPVTTGTGSEEIWRKRRQKK
jgi:filamentous hemagglutinin family protein